MVKIASACLLATLGTFAATNRATADPEAYYDTGYREGPAWYSYNWSESRLKTGIGVGFTVGGGIAGFTDQTMRNAMAANVNGLWDLRASIGTHVPLGLDVTYLGTSQNINTFNGAANGTLVGTTVEAALRYNVLPHADWSPYFFTGIGWQRYDVTSMKFATSDTGIGSSDNLVDFPMGTGIAYRDVSGLTVDLRGTFRPTTSSTLVLDPRSGAYADLHTWEASGAIGYEF